MLDLQTVIIGGRSYDIVDISQKGKCGVAPTSEPRSLPGSRGTWCNQLCAIAGGGKGAAIEWCERRRGGANPDLEEGRGHRWLPSVATNRSGLPRWNKSNRLCRHCNGPQKLDTKMAFS